MRLFQTNVINWLKSRLKHKLGHFSMDKLRKFLKENGPAFVAIFVIWEIIEDILFPALFIWLGGEVDPWFFTFAPVSWLLCLHPIVVPVLWWLWTRFTAGAKRSS